MSTDGFEPMTDATSLRSLLFADFIGKRLDKTQRSVIEQYTENLVFEPIDHLMISPNAWTHAATMGVRPQLVFAHPEILQTHPETSLCYRGMALLSRKRVAQVAVSITNWEDGTRKAPVRRDAALSVACFYNTVISSIIEGSTDWTLDNGYRNILATMGITLDGMFRNKIGDMAETLVKSRIFDWLNDKELISSEEPVQGMYEPSQGALMQHQKSEPNIEFVKNEQGPYVLPQNTLMQYGSEPDIAFVRNDRLVATIEIKGGTDPAGALERLGAMTKSFAETPPGCMNFLVAGVITQAMRARLDNMANVKVYSLGGLSQDGEYWEDFTNEVFHHALRII